MRRLVVMVPAVAVLLLPSQAGALWSSTASGSARVGATTMTNAGGFSAACTRDSKNSSVTLNWTISPDSFVEGYEIIRTGAGGGTNATIQVARTTAGITDSPPTGAGIRYTYTIRSGSTSHAWTASRLSATGTPTYSKTGCTS